MIGHLCGNGRMGKELARLHMAARTFVNGIHRTWISGSKFLARSRRMAHPLGAAAQAHAAVPTTRRSASMDRSQAPSRFVTAPVGDATCPRGTHGGPLEK